MRKAPIQNSSTPDDAKEESEKALELTEEVKAEVVEKPLPAEEEKN